MHFTLSVLSVNVYRAKFFSRPTTCTLVLSWDTVWCSGGVHRLPLKFLGNKNKRFGYWPGPHHHVVPHAEPSFDNSIYWPCHLFTFLRWHVSWKPTRNTSRYQVTNTNMIQRNKLHLCVPRYQTSVGERGCLATGLKLYNRLPRDIIAAPTTSGFKKKLKEFLMLQEFYSVREYLEFKHN